MSEILIVDDHPVFADGLQKLILEKKLAKKCIIAYSCNDCRTQLQIFNPNLILLDYYLPDGSGIDLCKEILKKHNSTKILAISSFREQSIVKLMLCNGASGYILKNASEEEIIEAIQTVLAGKTFISEEVSEPPDMKAVITGREVQILKCIAEGLTNSEIAEKLFLSTLTVERHRKNIILKMNAKNTASLIYIAMKLGYI